MRDSSLALRPPVITFPDSDAASHSMRVYRRSARTPIVHVEGVHTHHFFVLLFVEKGEGTVQLARGTLPLAPGSFHLLFPGETHDTGGCLDLDGWVVEFTEDVLAHRDGMTDFFGAAAGRARWARCLRKHEPHERRVRVPETRMNFISSLCDTLCRELAERHIGYRDAARATLQLILLEVLRLQANRVAEKPRHPLVEEALGVIDAHYTETFSLTDVARLVGRSSTHLAQLMKEHTGKTVLEWIAERRLDDARRRLRETDENVTVIGERVGYGSTNQFIRQFRRVHGVTPGAWRHAHHEAA